MLKKLWENFKIWRETRKVEKAISEAITNNTFPTQTISLVQDHQQQQYQEAMINLKKKLKELSGGNLENYLQNNPNFLALAERERSEVLEIMRRAVVKVNSDIKTQEDTDKMIQQRIGHYKELQRYNEEKALIAKIRAAKKAGDMYTHDILMQEWREQFSKQNKYQN